ncbi:MAG: hypothetical protein EON58_08375 [Alphaproteobacteria bacterium]|nr:MAG: hypothetical protein EON58_08375 [Alphaproteobacteria bacterium]
MKVLPLLAISIAICGCKTASDPRMGREWQNHMHEVGESYPAQGKAIELLGPPDNTKTITTDGGEYAPMQPLYCARLPAGTELTVLTYTDEMMIHFLYFKDGQMQCRASQFPSEL